MIITAKVIQAVIDNPAMPIHWGKMGCLHLRWHMV